MPGGFADSPLQLNHRLAKLDHWDADEIRKRAEALGDVARKIWPYPVLSPEKVEQLGVKKGSPDNSISNLENRGFLHGPMLALYEELRKRILNLDPSIRIQYKKLYIAFKTSTNFVDVEPRKNRFVLYLNMRFDEIHDPKSLCRDVSNIGHWGNGDIEIGLSTMEQLDDVMYLVKQSYERHDDNEATTSQPGLWTTAEA